MKVVKLPISRLRAICLRIPGGRLDGPCCPPSLPPLLLPPPELRGSRKPPPESKLPARSPPGLPTERPPAGGLSSIHGPRVERWLGSPGAGRTNPFNLRAQPAAEGLPQELESAWANKFLGAMSPIASPQNLVRGRQRCCREGLVIQRSPPPGEGARLESDFPAVSKPSFGHDWQNVELWRWRDSDVEQKRLVHRFLGLVSSIGRI